MAQRARALAALLPVLASCMDYQFKPVGRCLLQPASVKVQLPKTSSADLLFVVDDSGSMEPKQAGLAASFDDFIQRMVERNTDRVARGLQPIDFQIAVTTSSIFQTAPASTSCVGGNSCCTMSACTNVASCTRGTEDGCGAGQVCVTDQVLDPTYTWVAGIQSRCCTPSACTPSPGCSLGDRCPILTTSFPNPLGSNCTPGVAVPGAPYAAGQFVSHGSNPKVLVFPKSLDWASWGTATPDPALVQLVNEFKQNIQVGSCGSGEEQHLEAARRAVQLATAGSQPGVAGGSFPRHDAKFVVIWVGDEDDCSSPVSAPLVVSAYTPGADSCSMDKHLPAASQRELPVSDYGAFFAALKTSGDVADLGAAFIVSAVRCSDGSYAPADVCAGPSWCPVTPPASCAPPVGVCGGAYAAGERFFTLADQLRSVGAGIVEGTVCDAYPPASFGPVLAAIADLAQPPSMLELPTLPAARAVTAVAIMDGSQLVKTCRPGVDWCFVDCANPGGACLSAGTSMCIAIDHTTGQCEADAGQTYSAEYLGMLPAGGCLTASDCASALGGTDNQWSCVIESGMSRGTCTCTGS